MVLPYGIKTKGEAEFKHCIYLYINHRPAFDLSCSCCIIWVSSCLLLSWSWRYSTSFEKQKTAWTPLPSKQHVFKFLVSPKKSSFVSHHHSWRRETAIAFLDWQPAEVKTENVHSLYLHNCCTEPTTIAIYIHVQVYRQHSQQNTFHLELIAMLNTWTVTV